MTERPLLTADWRKLLLLNFAVPAEVIERLAPPGTEPDFHDGRAYISIVGFRFENVRLLGLPFPGHTNFPEINLRYYVRRTVAGEIRRGVVFAREIVPRRAVAILANRLYNENYVTRPMRSQLQIAGHSLAANDTISYTWRNHSRFAIPLPFKEGASERSRTGLREGSTTRSASHHWNRLAARVATPLAVAPPNSLEEFFIEHYWGYVRGRDGQTREYRVAHNPWRVAAADSIIWDCDVATTYDSPLAEYLAAPPTSAIIAEGSPVEVYRGAQI